MTSSELDENSMEGDEISNKKKRLADLEKTVQSQQASKNGKEKLVKLMKGFKKKDYFVKINYSK